MNLILYLRGRRPDGFHLLESLVAPVSLFDRVTLEFIGPSTDKPRVQVQHCGIAVPAGEQNIATRAFLAYASALGKPMPEARILLEKFIPVGAGLGGGSSNAAAVLWLLQRALGHPLEDAEVLRLASGLGADVPFFLRSGPAIMTGLGEILEPVTLPRVLYMSLCSDGSSLLTSEVYAVARRSLTAFDRVSNIRAFVEGKVDLEDVLHNDLEPAAMAIHPRIERMKKEAEDAGAIATSMTGSGSCVFGLCLSWAHARQVSDTLRARGYWALPVQTLTKTWVLC